MAQAFNILSKPPPENDHLGWYRWFYRICEILNTPITGAGTPASTVVSETTAGQSPAVGTSTNYAREDHTHGTPASGSFSWPPSDGKIYVARNGAWEELIIS